MGNNEVKRWKIKTYKNVDVLFEDIFYARTPDMNKTYPPTPKATYTIISENNMRSTVEEIPLDPLPEPKEKTNEETVKENPSMDSDKSPKI